jgi:hypothetical protein
VSQFDQNGESLDLSARSGVFCSVMKKNTQATARLDRIASILDTLSNRDAFEGPALSHDPLWLELEQLSQEENDWADRQFTASI